METDLERLKALLTDFKVGWRIDECNLADKGKGTTILCEVGEPRIEGSWGCRTLFDFDRNGRFIEMGAWE